MGSIALEQLSAPPVSGSLSRRIRSTAALSTSVSDGSISISAWPVPTWTWGATRICRIFPEHGASTGSSVFIASCTAMRSPAVTSSPSPTANDSRTAGAGERTTPTSSRDSRWGMPSTSTSCSLPWLTEGAMSWARIPR